MAQSRQQCHALQDKAEPTGLTLQADRKSLCSQGSLGTDYTLTGNARSAAAILQSKIALGVCTALEHWVAAETRPDNRARLAPIDYLAVCQHYRTTDQPAFSWGVPAIAGARHHSVGTNHYRKIIYLHPFRRMRGS